MSDAGEGASAEATRDHWLVVLLAPEALADEDLEKIGPMLARSRAVRALASVAAPTHLRLAQVFEKNNIPAQWLLGPDVEVVAGNSDCVARMPRGIDPNQQDELALGLADLVIASPGKDDEPLLRRARALGARVLRPGDRLEDVPLSASVADSLDPDARVRPGRWPLLNGRFEQACLEVFAFNWLGSGNGGMSRSMRDLRRCFGRNWRPKAFFASPGWIEHDVDREGQVCDKFECLDRSAVFGSRVQRDMVWTVHLSAGAAVCAAVAGVIFKPYAGLFGFNEFAILAAILALVFSARRSNLQEQWTACRLGAEQLRAARMCLPLLALPRVLVATDAQPAVVAEEPPPMWAFWRWPTFETKDLTQTALAEARRAVRDRGLPRRVLQDSRRAAEWICLIVKDQAAYHEANALKLEWAEGVFRTAIAALFALALVAVFAELALHDQWAPNFLRFLKTPRRIAALHGNWEFLLFFTAAIPAFAASLQGVETRLGIVHRIALSKESARRLKQIDKRLGAIIDAPLARDSDLLAVRDLALDAADAMSSENTTWHALVRRERDHLPA